jgi:RNase adapter protein RapZ
VGAQLPAGQLVVVTGMSGAGRSTAAKELEDLGYYVIDNLPPSLVGQVVELVNSSRGLQQPIGLVVDIRSGAFFDDLQAALARGTTGRDTTLLFLDATDDVLVRRQEAARRPHPLQGDGRLLDGLVRERSAIADLRSEADLVIDTSALNVHQLTDRIAESFGTPQTTALRVNVLSFGFKYGIPIDSDFVADMRFLPNPFWVSELRDLTGMEQDVATYVTNQPRAKRFVAEYLPTLRTAAEGYLYEGKRFLTVAVGCTGGKHRSVAMAEHLAQQLGEDMLVQVTHRDLGRE